MENSWYEVLPRFNLLPEGAVPNIYPLVETINNVACFMPVTTFWICLFIWIALANIDLMLSAFHWVIRKIPGLS